MSLDDVDWGIVAPVILGAVGAKFLKAKQKANNLNQYANTLNSALQSQGGFNTYSTPSIPKGQLAPIGTQFADDGQGGFTPAPIVTGTTNPNMIPYQKKGFFWGDDAGMKESLKAAYDANLKDFQRQRMLNEVNSRLPQGVNPFQDEDMGKAFFGSVTAPEYKATAERTRKIQEADALRDFYSKHPEFIYSPDELGAQQSQGGGAMGTSSPDGTFQAGAQTNSNLPEFQGLTTDEMKEALGNLKTVRDDARLREGQNIRNDEYNNFKKPFNSQRLEKIKLEIRDIQNMLDLKPALARARIAALQRSGVGRGHSISELELLIRNYGEEAVAQMKMDSLSNRAQGSEGGGVSSKEVRELTKDLQSTDPVVYGNAKRRLSKAGVLPSPRGGQAPARGASPAKNQSQGQTKTLSSGRVVKL
jgi:hypothetical protein